MESIRKVYLDYAATTPIDEGVLEAMLPYFKGEYGNPSSLYESGRKAMQAIESARTGIANILNAKSEEIIFTGSGTESDNMAILGVARANKEYGNHVLVSSVEHKAVLESARELEKEGFVVGYIPVDSSGMIDVDACMKLVTDKTILISVMYANNEVGTIEPIQELGRRVQEIRSTDGFPLLHTDACQAAGYLSLNVKELGVDLMSLNGGKIYGPKGVGVLYKKSGITIEPIVFGGGQEKGLRSGTESVALIAGMHEALKRVEEKRDIESKRLAELRDYCIERLRAAIPDIVVNGHPTSRLPNNVHISIPDIEGESIILMLDEKGIQASTGSACSSHDLEVSHVLRSIGQDENLMHGSVRFSLGKDTTQDDIEHMVVALSSIVKRLRSMSSLTLPL